MPGLMDHPEFPPQPQRIRDQRATIVGAGLGGLTAALALLRAGWRVRVYEQAKVLGEVGAGVTLSPGALKALARLGLGPRLLGASLPVPNVAFLNYRTGALLAGALDQGRPVDGGLETPRHIHRADLHAILLRAVQALDPASVATDKRLVGVAPDDAGVDSRFADGTTDRADILIGADGARSVVRRQAFEDRAPEFAGQVAFRCLIPFEEAAPFMGTAAAAVSIGAGRIFHRYPIRGGTLVNVIGIARTECWTGESWSTPAAVFEFLQAYQGFHDDVVGLIKRAPAEHLIKWGLFTRPPLPQWSQDRMVLLGDAAHPILPFLGLGAALAIEDAIVLVRALSKAASAKTAFEAFQAARRERVETVRTKSIEQGEIIQGSDPDADAVTRSPSQNVDLFAYDPCEAPIHVEA
jgi:salicylate hydroxylase